MSICTIKVFDHLHCAIATFNAAAHSRKTDGEEDWFACVAMVVVSEEWCWNGRMKKRYI